MVPPLLYIICEIMPHEYRERYVPRGVYLTCDVLIERGEGPFVYDSSGKEYIDFTTGIAVLNLGHRPPKVVEAIKGQADKFLHQCIHVADYMPYLELAKRLSESFIWGEAKTLLLNSGAEALENAVKISRYYRKAPGIIVFDYAFHGRTLLTMSMTSKFRPYKYGFYAYAPGIVRLPYPYPYRCVFGSSSPEDCGELALEFFEHAFKTYIDPDEAAAVVLEPVIGEGGYIVPPKNFVEGVAKIAREYGILYVSDEVQTGMGRTGTFWAIEQFNAEPDLITVGKAVASGLPLSAVIGRKDIMDSVHEGGLGGTFGGNPVSAAAALATVEEIRNVLGHAKKLGEYMEKRLDELYDKYDVIGEHRGLGPMRALEFVKDRRSKEPYKKFVGELIREGVRNGILLLSAGIYGNVIRVVPPINIEFEVFDEGVERLERSIKNVLQAVVS